MATRRQARHPSSLKTPTDAPESSAADPRTSREDLRNLRYTSGDVPDTFGGVLTAWRAGPIISAVLTSALLIIWGVGVAWLDDGSPPWRAWTPLWRSTTHADPDSSSRAQSDAFKQQALRELIRTDPEAAARWQEVRRQARVALSVPPRPLRRLHYESLLPTNARRIDTTVSLNTLRAVDPLAWAYIVEIDDLDARAAYAAAIRRHVVAWAGTYVPVGNPINEEKLEPLWRAYDLTRGTFTLAERRLVDRWLRHMARAQIRSASLWPFSFENNWQPKRLNVVAAAGRVLDDATLLAYARDGTLRYIDVALHPDGTSNDLRQRDALQYHIGGVRPLLTLLDTLDAPELYDWTAPRGGSIRQSVHFVLPYARGDKIHTEFDASSIDLDHERAAAGLPQYQPGRPFDPRDAIDMLELAGRYDPALLNLANRLHGHPGRYASWSVVTSTAWRAGATTFRP